MYRALYSLLFYLLVPLILVRLWIRGFKAPAYRHRWKERFGFGLPQNTAGVIWIHSVSVGETLASIPMVRQLQSRYPSKKILVTTMTPTGSERVKAAFGDSVLHCYLPYDLPFSIARFLRHFQPSILVVMETELWPNLIAGCKRLKIPVIIANARLSEKSARGYQRFKTLSSEMLSGINIATQTAEDAERFLDLGADKASTKVSGNIKYELLLPENIRQRASLLRDKIFAENCPVWIAASTHQNEDELVLEIHKQLLKINPKTRLIIVPRHPERFSDVAELCQRKGFNLVRRSEGLPKNCDAEIFLGDSMGELLLFYAMADVAFVGGSLVETGGHNLLEPAAFSCPVVIGPFTYNFHQITNQMITVGAAVQTDFGEMPMAISRWLEDKTLREKAGAAGVEFVKQNRGTLEKLLMLIEQCLKDKVV